MNGKVFAGGLVGFSLIFGAALWYFQVHAWYRDVSGLTAVDVQGVQVPVSDYVGVDAETSPNKLRGCFTVDPGAFEGVPLAENPDPLIAPPRLSCFDAEQIARDLEAGAAVAYLAGDETPQGATGYEVVRMIAVYPDGRAYLWRHYRED